jgi:signal peptidase II
MFWPLLALVFAADFLTKRLAVQHLSPAHVPHEVIGNFLRFTLAYNQDAAMGFSLGAYSRIGFTVTAVIVLVVIGAIYRRLPADSKMQGAALALIAAGALGNLTDRLMSVMGVVDFIDIGFGDSRFWTFNLADAAVTAGALLLLLVSMKEGKPKSVR